MRPPRVIRYIECPAPRVYALVADVESYPEFMPGWREARVLAQRDGELDVEQRVGAGPWQYRLRSIARLAPPRAIEIRGSGSPFARFFVQWTIEPDGVAARVSLRIECEFDGPAGLVLAPVVRTMPARAMSALALRARRAG